MRKLAIVLFVIGSLSSAFGQEDYKPLLQEANNAYMDKKYEEALVKYEKVLQIGIPDSIDKSWVFGYAALCSEELSQPEKAKSFYRQAVEYGYPNPTIYNKMVTFSKKNNDTEGQEFALLKLKKNFSDESASANNRLVALYTNTKSYDKLNVLYDELIIKDTADYKLYYNKATVLGQLNKLDEAKKYYLKTLSINPSDPNSNMNIGLMLYNQGTVIYDREKSKYNKLAKPSQMDYVNYQRSIRRGKDLYLEAETYLVKSGNADTNPAVKKALFNIYDRTEQPAKAQKYR